MITNVSCKDKLPVAFGRVPAIKKRPSSSFVSWKKLFDDIEALPKRDSRLGRLIKDDKMYNKTLCDRRGRVEPKHVREFFLDLARTIKKKIEHNKKPLAQRRENLALFVKKVLYIFKRNEETRLAAKKIAARYNIEI